VLDVGHVRKQEVVEDEEIDLDETRQHGGVVGGGTRDRKLLEQSWHAREESERKPYLMANWARALARKHLPTPWRRGAAGCDASAPVDMS
jgi:hypothetical protein